MLVATGAAVERTGVETVRAARVGGGSSFAAAGAGLPAPVAPAFTPRKPRLLGADEARSRFASIIVPAIARETPSAGAAPVARLEPQTTDGTTNIVLVVGDAHRGDDLWVRVRLAELPNNRTGWVPRPVLGPYRFVRTHLVVDRASLTAVLLYDGRAIFRAPVGVGLTEAPTPAGEFYVRDKLSGFGDAFYGPVAFGTSARSAVLTDWPDGGVIGIHGTNQPELIPGRVSHGCIRMRNSDILELSRLMPVGTPLTIT